MKKISDCLSPMNWAVLYLASFLPLIVVFRPSVGEFFLLQLVDTASYFLFVFPLEKYFFHLLPKYRAVFSPSFELLSSGFSARSSDEIRKNISLVLSLPRDRAKILFFGSWLKCAPALLFVTFVIKSNYTPTQSFFLYIFILFHTFLFFTSIGYFEAHRHLSKKLALIIEKYSLGEALLTLDVRPLKSETLFFEQITLYFLFFSCILLQILLILGANEATASRLGLELLAINLISYALFFRFRYFSQKIFLDGLFDIFNSIDQISLKNYDYYLPLHTHGALAKFELSINQLLKKIRDGDKETTYWMLAEAEKERFKSIGEISAYILHDLSGPFNVIKFIFQRLNEDPLALTKSPDYLDVANANLDKVFELTDSLRAKLKNKDGSRQASVFDVHKSTVRLLETQFYGNGLANISFDFDPELENTQVAFNSVDLGQVFNNLYRNAIESIIKRGTLGHIRTHFAFQNDSHVGFLISDDSGGMTSGEFEKLISFQFDSKGTEYRSLGLKLTHRLVETHGGFLSISETPHFANGTSFLILLPLYKLQNQEVKNV